MELSLGAIAICSRKYGKGPLCGFSTNIEGDADAVTSEAMQRIYDELVANELIVLSEEEVHISALGQHILNMMISALSTPPSSHFSSTPTIVNKAKSHQPISSSDTMRILRIASRIPHWLLLKITCLPIEATATRYQQKISSQQV